MFFDDENKDLIEENKEIPQEETHEYVENNQEIPDEIVNENYEQEVVEPAKPAKKKKGKVRKTIEWILTGLFAAVFIVFAAAQIDGMVHKGEHFGQEIKFGFSAWIVWTDSMEPDYMVDTALVNYLEDEQTIVDRFNRGETVDITFWSNELYPFITPKKYDYLTREIVVTKSAGVTVPVMTHRLVEIQQYEGKNYFITTGINYTEKEYSKKEQYQVFTYDKILGVVKHNSPALGAFFKFISSIWGLLILLLVPALYLAVTSIIDILKTLKENEEAPVTTTNKGVSSLDELSEKDKERLKREMLEDMLSKRQAAKEKKDEEN